MSIISATYRKLPIAFQNLAISAYGLGWRKRRFGGVFDSELIDFKKRENFTAQQWGNYTSEQLRKLLLHAFETVPFYKTSFKKAGIGKEAILKVKSSDFSNIPFLAKEDLREFGKTTLLSSIREKGGEFFASSGSTGTPTQILFSHAMHQRWSAGFEATDSALGWCRSIYSTGYDWRQACCAGGRCQTTFLPI
jgi:phenylacetate-CoA ligase